MSCSQWPLALQNIVLVLNTFGTRHNVEYLSYSDSYEKCNHSFLSPHNPFCFLFACFVLELHTHLSCFVCLFVCLLSPPPAPLVFLLFLSFFFPGAENQTQGLVLATQKLYHWAKSSNTFTSLSPVNRKAEQLVYLGSHPSALQVCCHEHLCGENVDFSKFLEEANSHAFTHLGTRVVGSDLQPQGLIVLSHSKNVLKHGQKQAQKADAVPHIMCWEQDHCPGLGAANTISLFDLIVGSVLFRKCWERSKALHWGWERCSQKGECLETLKNEGAQKLDKKNPLCFCPETELGLKLVLLFSALWL